MKIQNRQTGWSEKNGVTRRCVCGSDRLTGELNGLKKEPQKKNKKGKKDKEDKKRQTKKK